MSMEELENRFFEICTMDYSRMQKAYQPLKELMDRTDRVHITAKDTERVKGPSGSKRRVRLKVTLTPA